VVRKVIVTE
jgi:dihydrofolate reductase